MMPRKIFNVMLALVLILSSGCYLLDLSSPENPGDPDTYSPVTPDSFENDSSFTNARSVTLPINEVHSIYTSDDEDWVSFSATSGYTYTIIMTSSGGNDFDSYLYLYDDLENIIDSNDDFDGTWSQITWVCTGSGTYYVMAGPFGGDTGDYRLQISESP
jgi:hypothetical protein